MTKPTLLELTQDVLLAIESDAVNSINDTLEATQVAKVIKRTFETLSDEKNWPHQKDTFILESLIDTAKPTHLRLPENVKELQEFNYNKRKVTDTNDKYSSVKYLAPEVFLRRQNGLDSSVAEVVSVILASGITLFVRNDNPPARWTSFDDNIIVADSFDSAVETTLQQTKTQCWGYKNSAELVLADTSVPDLPEEMFSMLRYESISVASVEIRQADNPKAEQSSRRQRIQQSVKSWRTRTNLKLPDLGYRRGRDRNRHIRRD